MRMPPSTVDPRVRTACEVVCEAVFVRGGVPAAEVLSVDTLAQNVTRALREAKKAMSDSNDVSVIARRELFLAVMGARGSWRLGPDVARLLVDNLETTLLKSLAPEDPPTTPLLSSGKFQISSPEINVKALEEALLGHGWGKGGWTPPYVSTHSNGGMMDLEYRPLYGEVHFGLEDSPGLEKLLRQDMNPPGLGALDRVMRDEWATVVDARKNGLAVSGTNETGPFDSYKRTEA